MAEEQVPVLLVGGSLVGLTTSALLASHGIRHMLVERHRGTAIHPRAAAFHQRTMEVFRSIGLQQAVETAAAREFVQNGAIVAVDSLSGKELACFYRSFNEGVAGLSPTSRLFITASGFPSAITLPKFKTTRRCATDKSACTTCSIHTIVTPEA